ncbi:MAG: protoheme IX farnesyltransferase [Verrucomicrobiales bacterium]|nr:protoheme IX farnesyltransferase [Verrucomicrobiales bacterium]
MARQTQSQPAIDLSSARQDLMMLTKARLSLLVVITTLFGYLVAVKMFGGFSWPILLHTVFGTVLAAFGSAVFNQLMEVEADAKMDRTAERPLPANRIPRPAAFVIGFLLAGFGIVHLSAKVNGLAAAICAATLFTYLFVYTPLKRKSSTNTLVGAVSGALPPLIGWAAGGGGLLSWGSAFLFLLLFLWQLPHFLAINWMYREQYRRGGFVMWANDDDSGALTAKLAIGFSIVTAALPILPVLTNLAAPWFAIPGILLGAGMVALAFRFFETRERSDARKLFFYTLLYLPLVLGIALAAWKSV